MYAALPFELRPQRFKRRRWDSNPQPADYKSCTPIGSRSCISGDEGWSELPAPKMSAASRKQLEAEAVGIEPCTPIRQSPLYPNAQRRVAKSVVYYGRPYQQPESPIVDRPLCLRETPAPFTSRSPGIATLGPSCTPSRQLGNVVQLSKAQRGIIETGLFGSQTYNLDVVPTGSWAVV